MTRNRKENHIFAENAAVREQEHIDAKGPEETDGDGDGNKLERFARKCQSQGGT